jgi:hypothetical protein
MSENYRFYLVKMAEQRAERAAKRPLHGQLVELMAFVKTCEHQWATRRWSESSAAD